MESTPDMIDQKSLQRFNIIDRIIHLYNNSIEKFRKGQKSIYNPMIFTYMTLDDFINWIITNNREINNLL